MTETSFPSSISDYFAHKCVFITGGTGFLGTVTIEALLSSSPDIGNIYILVRDKNGFSAKSRLQKLLQKPVSNLAIIIMLSTYLLIY
jgi:alcohol-forming fatty acyl-CoA reductase